MFDPNWFYSTIAQSSAAIIGLVGAFIVSKSISISGERRQLLSQIEAAELEAKVLKEQIEPFEKYVKDEDRKQDLKNIEDFLKEESSKFEDEPEKMNFENDIKEYQSKEKTEIEDVEHARKKFGELEKDLIEWKASGIKKSQFGWPANLSPLLLSSFQYTGPSRYRQASDEIYETSNKIYLISEKTKFFKNSLDSLPAFDSFKPVISGLTILSFTGLIIPVLVLIFQGDLAVTLQIPVASLFFWSLYVNYRIARKEIGAK
jgi:hypothetical protein